MRSYTLCDFDFNSHYAQVRDLWSRSGPGVQVRRSDEADEIRKKLERDPDLFLVAEAQDVDGPGVIGSVIGGFDGRRGMVYHLAVDAAWRQQGVGAALMEELERRLKAKGCRRAYLMLVNGNDLAANFYEKRGWEPMTTLTTYAKDIT